MRQAVGRSGRQARQVGKAGRQVQAGEKADWWAGRQAEREKGMQTGRVLGST